MSFPAKVDVYGLAEANKIIIQSTTGGETATNVEATGEDGSIVANSVIGELANPSCDMQLQADVTKAAGAWKIGGVTTSNSKKFALEKISITTSGGAAPSISVSGKQVNSGATTGCYYPVPAFSLSLKHHAQILFSAFTLAGTGVHLTGASYEISGNINVVTIDGVPIAFDVTQGKIEVSVTIKQCGEATPVLSAGTGFEITSPLASSNPDADYPTWTATLTQYLTKSDAASQQS